MQQGAVAELEGMRGRPSHRSKTGARMADAVESLESRDGHVRVERPTYCLVKYYLDGEYVVTRGIYQLLCEHELPEWRA